MAPNKLPVWGSHPPYAVVSVMAWTYHMFCPWLDKRIYFTFGEYHPAYRSSYLSLNLEEATLKIADAYATTTKTLRLLAK